MIFFVRLQKIVFRFLNKNSNINISKFLQHINILVIWRHLFFTWCFLFYGISTFINSIIITIRGDIAPATLGLFSKEL